METKLIKKQEKLNKQYEKQGLTDEILEKQIEINKLRHEHNIPDQDEFLYKNFSQ